TWRSPPARYTRRQQRVAPPGRRPGRRRARGRGARGAAHRTEGASAGPVSRAAPRSAPAPPRVHEVVHDLAELADGAALAHDVARGCIERHHAVADAPAPLPLGVEPDDALHALADEAQRPRLRIVVVAAGVAEHQDGRLLV